MSDIDLWGETEAPTYRPFVQKIQTNTHGRDFVVGDLHGHYDLLLKGLKEIAFNPSVDRVFSVGDLIDRGPDSALCLRLLKQPWFFAVMGNHELMMLGRATGEGPAWMKNGGEWWHDTFPEESLTIRLFKSQKI